MPSEYHIETLTDTSSVYGMGKGADEGGVCNDNRSNSQAAG